MTEPLEIVCTHLSPRGEGVGSVGDREVMVPGLFAGERARVAIAHRSRAQPRDFGQVVRLLEWDPARRAAPCPRHESRGGRCTGCPLMELEIDAQREQKRGMLAAIGLEVAAVVGAEPLGYRHSSKRVAYRDRTGLRLGSWTRGTHRGADMEGCLVDHPRIVAAADELALEARALAIEPYDESSGGGDFRYAWLKTDGEGVLLTLVSARAESRIPELAKNLVLPVGIAWSVQPSRGNAMRGQDARVLSGRSSLRLDGREIGPLGFYQPNPVVIARALDDLLRDEAGAPLSGALAWDLYAGTGATTALLRERFATVLACESDAESARLLGIEPRTVEDFLASEQPKADVVLLNPPRRGLGDDVCAHLGRLGIERLAIMACGPEGLARDLARLAASGYELLSLRAYDTLPQTPHVELVAKLARRAG